MSASGVRAAHVDGDAMITVPEAFQLGTMAREGVAASAWLAALPHCVYALLAQAVHARYGAVAGFIGLTSTVRDLALFLIAHLGMTAAGRAAIAPVVARRMTEPQVQLDSANRTHRVDMALGWFREVALDSRAATPLLWHYGNVDGHASAVFLRPVSALIRAGGCRRTTGCSGRSVARPALEPERWADNRRMRGVL